MKILISSKVLYNLLGKAISNKCDFFEINAATNEISFRHKQPRLRATVLIVGRITNRTDSFTFDTIKMFKLSNVLREIQEQPIVVEFDTFDEDSLSIKLSQFEYWF